MRLDRVETRARVTPRRDPYWHQRTVIQVARLKYTNGWLSVDRNETVRMPLKAP